MSKYPVNDVYGTIQGEGCQTGTAMVLVRLHGCGVGCPFCDTKETWTVNPEHKADKLEGALGQNERYAELFQSELTWYIAKTFRAYQWVLLTGGEPAQYRLRPLVTALHDAGYKVALETSGTEIGHLDAGCDWVCVSPKFDMPGGKVVLPEAVACADEIKHVVGKQAHIDRLDDFLRSAPLKPSAQICLQPISQSTKATELCIQTVKARGWRLSIQTHKYLALP